MFSVHYYTNLSEHHFSSSPHCKIEWHGFTTGVQCNLIHWSLVYASPAAGGDSLNDFSL